MKRQNVETIAANKDCSSTLVLIEIGKNPSLMIAPVIIVPTPKLIDTYARFIIISIRIKNKSNTSQPLPLIIDFKQLVFLSASPKLNVIKIKEIVHIMD
jgi:hypothetical protein